MIGVLVLIAGILALYLLTRRNKLHPKRIIDRYATFEELQQGLRKAGLEDCNLIVGIDCTKSNTTQGQLTWDPELSMHAFPPDRRRNPYQQVLRACGEALARFDEDQLIPVFGFGDLRTKGTSCFAFNNGEPCYTFESVLVHYQQEVPELILSGPTNFAPVIREACNIVQAARSFHILLIICDGQVTSPKETIQAIVDACAYPLSIVIIGVGDGPWDDMRLYDDGLPQRPWDNVQFVAFDPQEEGVDFATRVLQEIPEQYRICKGL